jgi:hypothetical protein
MCMHHACSSSTQVWTLTRVAGSILHQIVHTIFSFEQGWVPNEREAALSSSGGPGLPFIKMLKK